MNTTLISRGALKLIEGKNLSRIQDKGGCLFCGRADHGDHDEGCPVQMIIEANFDECPLSKKMRALLHACHDRQDEANRRGDYLLSGMEYATGRAIADCLQVLREEYEEVIR